MDTKQFKIDPQLILYLDSKGIKNYLPIQDKVIPLLLKDKQVIVEAPTGTGKTFAFLLPIISNMDFENRNVQTIIAVPTRELAKQIWNVIQEIKKFQSNFTTLLAIGGEDINRQLLKWSKMPQLIIATPERLARLMQISPIKLTDLKYLIIDEADMMLDFGFMEELERFVGNNVPKNKLIYGLFSATLPLEVQNFIKKRIHGELKNIQISPEEELTIKLIKADNGEKEKVLIDLLQADIFNPFFTLIFAKSNEEVKGVYAFLKNKGLKNLEYFTSDLSQRERSRVLKSVNNLDTVYLVTTDLMARGMDFPGVSHIINYSYPTDFSYYRHRIGRTNRNNINGAIYDIYEDSDKDKIAIIKTKNPFLKMKRFKF